MSTFPLYYLLIPFALVLLFSFIFFFFNIFHIRRYGVRHTNTTFLLFLYFSAYCITVGAIMLYLATIDWSQEFTLNEILPFSSSSNINGFDYGL